jgi:hypothetical protein
VEHWGDAASAVSSLQNSITPLPRCAFRLVPDVGSAPTSPPLQGGANLPQLLGEMENGVLECWSNGTELDRALRTLHSAFESLPAHAISTKNKHLLVIYSIPARGFTAAVSVFRGTPPPKPLECKSISNHLGALISDVWADPTGGQPRLSCA